MKLRHSYSILIGSACDVNSGSACDVILRVQNGVVGWTVTKQTQMIIHQAHSGNELCRHIVKPLALTTTQIAVFIQLKMMEIGTAINPLKMT